MHFTLGTVLVEAVLLIVVAALVADVIKGIRTDWDSSRWTVAAWGSFLCLFAAGALRDTSAYGWEMLLLLVGGLLLYSIHDALQISLRAVERESEWGRKMAAELQALRETLKQDNNAE